MATIDDIRRISLDLPQATEGTSYGTIAFRVAGKLFCRLRDDDQVLVVKTEPGHAEALIATEPEIYFTTPHYVGYDYILVRIGLASVDELESLLAEAWALAAPKRLRVSSR